MYNRFMPCGGTKAFGRSRIPLEVRERPVMHNSALRLTFLFPALLVLQLLLFSAVAPAQSTDKTDNSQSGIGPGRPAPFPVDDNDDPNRVYTVREVTKRAVLLSRLEPGFTEEARKNEVESVVRLRMVLGLNGKVSQIRVIKGLPDGLTEKAISAARAITFTPAQKDGRNVNQWVVVEYNFNIYYDEDDREITSKAVIMEKPEPQYTDEARRNGTQGTVVVAVILTKEGAIGSVEAVKTLPDGLTEKAIEAARAIKFRPAEASGRRVSVLRNIEYVFALN
ncbi:MAG TPA: energy transducer TonB [Pyrinomonadaceae bacterium]|nr:energy transducer TonB [Pyrinomonadaceae bacterium]